MLGIAAELQDQIEASGCCFDDVVLAIAFHDIFYIPGSLSNEEVSAEIWNACIRPIEFEVTKESVHYAIHQTKYLSEHTHHVKTQTDSLYKFRLTYWLQQIDLFNLIRGTRDQQLDDFFKVWLEFKDLCNGDKSLFERGHNEFLVKLAEKFDFEYRPITWSEVEAQQAEFQSNWISSLRRG
jgi:hypothetical protein